MAVQGASSSSLSSSTRWWTYDVFLSFRGEDTRQNFTSHLHQALDRKKIYTYIDYKLRRGQEISDELLKAIESSRISIVVLSKNYASSRWCLDELMKILECKKTKQQKVLPVFYDVDPTEVRNQREVFGKALAKLKERFKDESKVERWKAALAEVAGLSGFTLGDGTEPELIQEIVREVSRVVLPKYSNDVAKHPVGMESRVQDVHDILLRVGVNDTRILGIYGIGGIGKTTLAKAIYNTFTDQFEKCCFLANVRETSKSEYGLIKLQETLLCEILGDWSLKVRNKDEGMGQIKKMLWSKRVLLVLDDLDQWDEVEKYLLGGCDSFGLGSIIIITTRDEHLLTRNSVHLRYKVKELDRDEALQLFCWNAFKNKNPIHEFVEITENLLHYLGGHPLALMVLGSYLYGRDIHYWRSALEKDKRIPHKDNLETLKISYDGLDINEKRIFLDIACFFTGNTEEYVTKVLDGCGFFATYGIKVLVDKSLITISEWGRLIMNGLLKDMGREIVRQESPKEPEKRSRLWFHEDVRHVLEETKGTDKIEAILLDFPEGHDHMICLHSEAFMNMSNLRTLFINRNAQFSAGPNHLSNQIRVLVWAKYPSSFLPSNFYGRNLIEIQMPNSLIKDLGGLKSKNLTLMNLSGCKFLTKTPDLSSSPNLETLDLGNCENLVEIHHSVGFLDKLSSFSVNGCFKLRIFPKRFKLRSLRFFSLRNCSSLEDFPDIECEMEFLHELNLRGTSIKELPSSIENLKGLKKLYLKCSSLKKLPSSIGNLTRLEELNAASCKNLVHLPSSIDQLPSLRIVKVDGDSQVPIHIGKVEDQDGIQSTLFVVSTGKECEIASTGAELTPTNSSIFNDGIQSTLSVFHDAGSSSSANWKSVQVLSLRFCCLSESNFFTNGNYFPALVELDLSGSDIVSFPDQSVRFDRLRHLCLNNCKKLEEILPLPLSISKVEARECTSLESFALLSEILVKNNGTNFSNLLRIDSYGCHKLLANITRPIPSWEERHSKEQNSVDPLKERDIDIIFPGKRIPSWVNCEEAHDSSLCEIDINRPHHRNDMDEIVFYVVFGYRVGIIDPKMERAKFCVKIHDRSDWKDLYSQYMSFYWTDYDHVWMHWMSYDEEVDVSRFRFECNAEFAVFRKVGVHFLKKHEENIRDEDHTGVIYETPFKDFGPHSLY